MFLFQMFNAHLPVNEYEYNLLVAVAGQLITGRFIAVDLSSYSNVVSHENIHTIFSC